MEKTLIGKEGWLFLKNDACKELDVHCNNVCKVNADYVQSVYSKYMNKFLLTVIPNKSYVYSMYLPNEYNAQYRPAFDIYKHILGHQLLDSYDVLKITPDTYYKTDTHINFKGGYSVYKEWVLYANKCFSLNIPVKEVIIDCKEVPALSNLNLGIGDLTWEMNKGNQIIEDTSDRYFCSESVRSIYMVHKITLDSDIRIMDNTLLDITSKYNETTIVWDIVSKHIFHKINPDGINKRVLIFYDSFLLSTLSLYLDIFKETYMAKRMYDSGLIERIQPDLIFEFKVERFLL